MEARRREHRRLARGARYSCRLPLGLPFKFVGAWPCLFKHQASLRQVPSAVTPATRAPAADSGGSRAPPAGPEEQHLGHQERSC